MKKDANIYRELLESAAEGIIVVDVNGRIVLANAKSEELFGFRREELLGQELEILLPEARQQVHRAHRKHYLTNPRNRSMGIGLELVARRKDDSEFPVEIALSHAGKGDDMLVMASVSDITQRKQWEADKTHLMEDRIRELEETLHTLGTIAGAQEVEVTTRMMGILPLQEAAEEAFAALAESYGRIMDEALERKIYKSKGSISGRLAELGGRLGFLKATPRDVVDLHSRVLREKSRTVSAARMHTYLDEGHFLLVELIGQLGSYYRIRAFPGMNPVIQPQPEKHGKGEEDGR